ncbi:hypothetical protein DPEC_G00180970 [Dallia pectoralis]|uniref:Uncharacterized protein n=1 Tax=Dallia pectoralis TaxID=75939 RepID=A0ACC2GAK7_DALPE|nr:hypothetical protein DPEC_G00180970 [Dallia pectoralis]
MGNVSMLVVCVAVIFSLVSVSQTAPVSQTCEELLKPIEMKTTDLLNGNWYKIASLNTQIGARTMVKLLMKNMWSQISPMPLPNMLSNTFYMKAWDGSCASYNFNMTLEDNKLKWTYIGPMTSSFLSTCPDCILLLTIFTIHGRFHTAMDLYSRRREITAGELLHFKTQADCRNLSSVIVIQSTTEHCPVTAESIPNLEENLKKMVYIMEREDVNLVSVSQMAPVSHTCEELLKPLEMKTIDPLIGNWHVLASSNNQPGVRTLHKLGMDSLWSKFSPGPLPNTLTDTLHMRSRHGPCFSFNISMTLEDNKLKWTNVVPSTSIFLPTCPDCLLIQSFTTVHGTIYTSLALGSRRKEVTVHELLAFNAQVECLNLPRPIFIKSKTEYCPVTTEQNLEMEDSYRKMIDSSADGFVMAAFRVTDYLIEKAECFGLI